MPRTDVVFYQEAEVFLFSIGSKDCAGRINRRMRNASPLLSASRNPAMSLGGLLWIF